MKLLEAPQEVVKITLSRVGEKSRTITLVETDCFHAIEYARGLLSTLTVNILDTSEKLQITARGYRNSKAFDSKTISCRGLSVEQVEQMVINSLKAD